MSGLGGNQMLGIWERGRSRHALDRALLLYAAALGSEGIDAASSLADQPLGRRNLALLRWHEAWLGGSLNGVVDCPSCGERLEFALSVQVLLAHVGKDVDYVEVEGMRVRLPTTRDLSFIAREADASAAARTLCLRLVDGAELDEAAALELAPRIEAALDEADPCADVALDLSCASCGRVWKSSFDVPGYLWEHVEVHCRRLLDEVHVLASSYGWDERAILEMSETRRAAYLERVLG